MTLNSARTASTGWLSRVSQSAPISQPARLPCPYASKTEGGPIAEPVEQARPFGKHRPAGFAPAEAGELTQRGLAAQRLDQQKDLLGVLAVVDQVAHRAERCDRMKAGACGLRHGASPHRSRHLENVVCLP